MRDVWIKGLTHGVLMLGFQGMRITIQVYHGLLWFTIVLGLDMTMVYQHMNSRGRISDVGPNLWLEPWIRVMTPAVWNGPASLWSTIVLGLDITMVF